VPAFHFKKGKKKKRTNIISDDVAGEEKGGRKGYTPPPPLPLYQPMTKKEREEERGNFSFPLCLPIVGAKGEWKGKGGGGGCLVSHWSRRGEGKEDSYLSYEEKKEGEKGKNFPIYRSGGFFHSFGVW